MSGIQLYTDLAFGTAKSLLFIKVFSFQGVPIKGVPLCWQVIGLGDLTFR